MNNEWYMVFNIIAVIIAIAIKYDNDHNIYDTNKIIL